MGLLPIFQERALRSLHRRALTFLPRDSLQDCFLNMLEGRCFVQSKVIRRPLSLSYMVQG